jgi:hypothetical protein
MMGLLRYPYLLTLAGTTVQMTCMRPVFAPFTQSSCSAPRLRDGSSVRRAVRMNHVDIQQGGTMGRGKGHPCAP